MTAGGASSQFQQENEKGTEPAQCASYDVIRIMYIMELEEDIKMIF